MNGSLSDVMWAFPLIPLLLVVALVVGVAFIVFGRRNGGQASSRTPLSVPHLYGYGVCLVAILVGLAAVTEIPRSLMDMAAPIRSEEGGLPVGGAAGGTLSLTSYDAFRATASEIAQTPRNALLGRQSGDGQGQPTELWSLGSPVDSGEAVMPVDVHPSDQERAAYERLRSDRMSAVRTDAASAVTSALLGLVLCVVLFRAHARWLAAMESGVSPTAS
jgi:hypothetical protein